MKKFMEVEVTNVNTDNLTADQALFLMGLELFNINNKEEDDEETSMPKKTHHGKGHQTRLYGHEKAMKDHRRRGYSSNREKRLFNSGVLDKGSTFNDRKKIEKYDLEMPEWEEEVYEVVYSSLDTGYQTRTLVVTNIKKFEDNTYYHLYKITSNFRGIIYPPCAPAQYIEEDIHPDVVLPEIKTREDYNDEIIAKARELMELAEEAGYNTRDTYGSKAFHMYQTEYFGMEVWPGWADSHTIIREK